MYDIKKLEHEWEAYNKKRNRPIYITLVTSVLLIFVIYSLIANDYIAKMQKLAIDIVNNYSTSSKVSSFNEHPVVEKIDNESSMVIDKTNTASEKTVKKIVNTSRTKVDDEQNNIEEVSDKISSKNPLDIANNVPILEEVESLNKVEKTNETVINDVSKKKIKINIIEISDIVAYKDVEKRFYDTRDTDDSLFLARSYLKKEDYKKAEYWALETNKVDDSLEESWLIFIESKYNLGQKSEAIKILKSYIDSTDSIQAKRLLKKLK